MRGGVGGGPIRAMRGPVRAMRGSYEGYEGYEGSPAPYSLRTPDLKGPEKQNGTESLAHGQIFWMKASAE